MANPTINEVTPGISYQVSGAGNIRARLQLDLIITGEAIFDVRFPAADTPAFTLIQGSSSIPLAIPANDERSSMDIPNRVVLWSTSDTAGVRNLHVRIQDPTFITPSETWILRATDLSTGSSYALVMALNAVVLGIDAFLPEQLFPDTPENVLPLIPDISEPDLLFNSPARGLIADASGLNIFYDSGLAFGLIDSDETGFTNEVYLARAPLADPGGEIPLFRITLNSGRNPCAIRLPSGEILLVYERQVITERIDPAGNTEQVINVNISLQRGSADDLATTNSEIDVDATEDLDKTSPFAVASGDQVIIVWTEALSGNVRFNRYDPQSDGFPGPIQTLSATQAAPGTGVFAAVDAAGVTWIAYPTLTNIHVVQLPLSGGAAREVDMFDNAAPNRAFPIVMMDQNRNMWIFWAYLHDQLATVEYRRFMTAAAKWVPPLDSPPSTLSGFEAGVNVVTSAIPNPDGSVWVFMHASNDPQDVTHIFGVHFDPDLERWGPMYQLTDAAVPDGFSQAVRGPDEALWLVWMRNIGSASRIFFRQLVAQA